MNKNVSSVKRYFETTSKFQTYIKEQKSRIELQNFKIKLNNFKLYSGEQLVPFLSILHEFTHAIVLHTIISLIRMLTFMLR